MQSHGEQRQPAETQSEFIQSVTQRLANRQRTAVSSREVAPSPSLAPIGDLFYRVRFGDEELLVEEATQMNELLTQLEQALGNASNTPARSR